MPKVQLTGVLLPPLPRAAVCEAPRDSSAPGKQPGLEVFPRGNTDDPSIQKKRTQKSFCSHVLKILQRVSAATPGVGIPVRPRKLDGWKRMGRSSVAVLGTLRPTTKSVAALRAPARTCPLQQGQPGQAVCHAKPSPCSSSPGFPSCYHSTGAQGPSSLRGSLCSRDSGSEPFTQQERRAYSYTSCVHLSTGLQLEQVHIFETQTC